MLHLVHEERTIGERIERRFECDEKHRQPAEETRVLSGASGLRSSPLAP
jgi:hypothetical protein